MVGLIVWKSNLSSLCELFAYHWHIKECLCSEWIFCFSPCYPPHSVFPHRESDQWLYQWKLCIEIIIGRCTQCLPENNLLNPSLLLVINEAPVRELPLSPSHASREWHNFPSPWIRYPRLLCLIIRPFWNTFFNGLFCVFAWQFSSYYDYLWWFHVLSIFYAIKW